MALAVKFIGVLGCSGPLSRLDQFAGDSRQLLDFELESEWFG